MTKAISSLLSRKFLKNNSLSHLLISKYLDATIRYSLLDIHCTITLINYQKVREYWKQYGYSLCFKACFIYYTKYTVSQMNGSKRRIGSACYILQEVLLQPIQKLKPWSHHPLPQVNFDTSGEKTKEEKGTMMHAL